MSPYDNPVLGETPSETRFAVGVYPTTRIMRDMNAKTGPTRLWLDDLRLANIEAIFEKLYEDR